MRRLVLNIVLALGLVILWYGFWRFAMADDVARVKHSIAYQNQQFKTVNPTIVLKAESVSPAGFPFNSRVRVERIQLSIIDGKETYAILVPELFLKAMDSDQGRYRVELPATVSALYAMDGLAPENYTVTMDKIPELLLRAQANSQQCSGLPGSKPCDAVAADAPLITFAPNIPASVMLHIELNGKSRDAQFTATPVNLPVFMDIPKAMARPLQLAVGVLREAMVFQPEAN